MLLNIPAHYYIKDPYLCQIFLVTGGFTKIEFLFDFCCPCESIIYMRSEIVFADLLDKSTLFHGLVWLFIYTP